MTTTLIFLAPGNSHAASAATDPTVPALAAEAADVLAEELELVAERGITTEPEATATVDARLAAIDASGVDLLARLDRLGVSTSQAVRLALGPLPAIGEPAPDEAVYTTAIADLRRAADTPSSITSVAASSGTPQTGLLAVGALALLALCGAALANARRRSAGLPVVDTVAWSDGLTGLANHRRFDADVQDLTGQPTAAILLDVDHLHDVNDDFGYGLGDHIVQEVGQRLGSLVRSGDVVYRFGGAEFCVLLPGASLADARAVADRIVDQVREIVLPDGRHVTVSAGVAVAENGPDVVRHADQALATAKQHGRDRAVSADEPATL